MLSKCPHLLPCYMPSRSSEEAVREILSITEHALLLPKNVNNTLSAFCDAGKADTRDKKRALTLKISSVTSDRNVSG